MAKNRQRSLPPCVALATAQRPWVRVITLLACVRVVAACESYDSGLLSQQARAPSVQSECVGDCPPVFASTDAPACGDGVIDPSSGESCDPGSDDSACPLDCDDGDDCTTDIMQGNPDDCDVSCTHTRIAIAVDDDACCPMGADGLTDSDCQPICGNQRVEPGERCDPCPASCDDHDACTDDVPSGSPATCDLSCSHHSISAFVDGDGCCPKGADASSDADCGECGNGIVDPGEECDGGAGCTRACTRAFQSSLVHRYSFDGTGTSVLDSVGGKNGRAINTSLNGDGTLTLAGGTSNQFVELPQRLVSGLANVTVEAWLQWNGGAERQRIFDFGMNTNSEFRDNTSGAFGSSTGQGTSYFFVTPRNSDGDIAAYLNFTSLPGDRSGDFIARGRNALSTSGIHQVAATFGSRSLRLYVDGELAGERSDISGRLSQIDDGNVWIGRANFPEDELGGILYDFRIYDQALSAGEVHASFEAGSDPH